MRDLNHSLLTGHLQSEVRPFTTADQKNGAEFTLAVKDHWHDRSGTLQQRTDYFDIVAYGDIAATALLLRKGNSVIVSAKLRNEDGPTTAGKSERKTKLRALHIATHREIKPARQES